MQTKPTVSVVSGRKSHGYSHSAVNKHNIMIVGHKTSISLENPFWDGLREIAEGENVLYLA
jgi:predicted DNA-binding ribbon-helix-helix protein